MPEYQLRIARARLTAEELREWRTTRQLTQAGLAEMLEVPVNTIARWERGEIQINQPRVLSLALQAISFSLTISATIHQE